ncbi:MAG: hypothetical protein V4533_14925 [Pseudomonadota bacterium]|jgi:hypothetical protein
MDRYQIIAVGLLTQGDLDRLGEGFSRIFPLEGAHDFEDLLKAIDQADIARGSGTGNLECSK